MSPWDTILKIAIAIAIALFSLAGNAVTVRGGPSCAAWLRERQASTDTSNYNEFWLLGYVSGLSVSSNTDVLRNTPNTSLMNWIDGYCRANSLHNLEEAGSELFFDLKRQKKLR